jgi:hypothetical protein
MGCICCTGLLSDMKTAIDEVVRVTEDYHKDGDSDLDALIEAYSECMGLVCSLWLELSQRVRSKFLERKWSTHLTLFGSWVSFQMPLLCASIDTPAMLVAMPHGSAYIQASMWGVLGVCLCFSLWRPPLGCQLGFSYCRDLSFLPKLVNEAGLWWGPIIDQNTDLYLVLWGRWFPALLSRLFRYLRHLFF